MKNLSAYFLLFAFCGLLSCKKDVDPAVIDIRGGGFSLYWHHAASYTQGRYTLFSLASDKRSDHSYALDFDVSVNGSKITAVLKSINDEGKCPQFPSPGWPGSDGLCSPEGRFDILHEELQPGTYTFEIQTGVKTIVSEIEVTPISRTIKPITSGGLSVNAPEIFALPENLIYGSVVYQGSDLEGSVQQFFKDLEALGMTPFAPEEHPYYVLDVTYNPHMKRQDWAEDNHSINILCKMNGSFASVTELAKRYFESSGKRIGFGLASSNGDEARMNQYDGVKIFERQ